MFLFWYERKLFSEEYPEKKPVSKSNKETSFNPVGLEIDAKPILPSVLPLLTALNPIKFSDNVLDSFHSATKPTPLSLIEEYTPLTYSFTKLIGLLLTLLEAPYLIYIFLL